ncbi:MAG: cytosine deaminase [Paraburkholderia sp.]|uniref:amidohydrolase family protein n=1 Tax=Paraburkholderia sp. TaxID=1926495 RepID=UPI001220CA45|nr:amidohydrolase family protein [Paraburkholderia sp.]TAL98476.1 MAG: cytosine deaminase [Paraburkholderia sp.]
MTLARILLKDATLVTMDDTLGDFPRADILIEGDRIVAVGPSLQDRDAEVITLAGCIVIPGLINAHMHTWQTGLRTVAANWTLLEYFRWMHAGLATCFTPADIFCATQVGALNQINCGTTTLVDWCHNNPTAAHTDAALDALIDAGIRATFMHGTPKPDPQPGQPHFSEIPHPRREIERLLRERFERSNRLVNLGLAILGPHYSTLDVARHDIRMAMEFGLVASMHQGGGSEKAVGGWEALDHEGLLGPWINVVHGNDLSGERMARLVHRGVSFSITPEGEMTQGHGFPVVGRLRVLGAAPSVGVDLESIMSGDMFSVMRMALGMQRAFDNAASRKASGKIPETSTITTREALSWATTAGARMLGMSSWIGSITPGKQADLVVIDATAINMCPAHDPVSAVVMQTSLANVDSVMIAGEWKKRHGRLLVADLPAKLERLALSGQRIARAMSLGAKGPQ